MSSLQGTHIFGRTSARILIRQAPSWVKERETKMGPRVYRGDATKRSNRGGGGEGEGTFLPHPSPLTFPQTKWLISHSTRSRTNTNNS